jgi:hypothetical protein
MAMKLAKRTYSLPPDLMLRFEERLRPGDRSGMVAKLIEEWLAARERDELCSQIVKGCHEMSGLYQDIDQEWSHAADEVWRGLE